MTPSQQHWTTIKRLLLLVPLCIFATIATTQAQAETYVTESRVQVDRCASAWFIKRFMDADARFVFFKSGKTAPEGISYDFYGAKYFHKGRDCTFTTLIKTHQQSHNKALQKMNQLVNDAFAWMQAPNSLGAQLRETITIILEETGDDNTTYQELFPVFDLAYHQLGGDPNTMLEAQIKISQDSTAELKNIVQRVQQTNPQNKSNAQKLKQKLIARIQKEFSFDSNQP